jgi:hypothetical protein
MQRLIDELEEKLVRGKMKEKQKKIFQSMVINDMRNPTESIYHGLFQAKKQLKSEMQLVTDMTLKFFEELDNGLLADVCEEEPRPEEVIDINNKVMQPPD